MYCQRLFVPLHSLFERRAYMVPVVQLVRASDCGSECRGFESHRAPQQKTSPKGNVFFCEKSQDPTEDIAERQCLFCEQHFAKQKTSPKGNLRGAFQMFQSCKHIANTPSTVIILNHDSHYFALLPQSRYPLSPFTKSSFPKE